MSDYRAATRSHRRVTALYACSADPITYGHMNIVERASRSFDEVIVGIGHNPAKKYLFATDVRCRLASQALAQLPNVRVQAFHGMVVDFASEQGADIIVKGVRNAADFDYEQLHHLVGLSQSAGIDTHLLFAEPTLAHISSSAVKAIQLEHGSIGAYVPPMVKAALEEALSGQVILGVTGQIAAGKSHLCGQLAVMARERGVALHHLDLDRLGHHILRDEASMLNRRTQVALSERLGVKRHASEGIDRGQLAATIFCDANRRGEAERIMRGPMTVALRKALYGLRGIVLLESAMLAELDLLALCNYRVILVDTPSHILNKRLSERGYSQRHAEERLRAQWSVAAKKAAVDEAIRQQGFGHRFAWDGGGLSTSADREQFFNEILRVTGFAPAREESIHAA